MISDSCEKKKKPKNVEIHHDVINQIQQYNKKRFT